MSEFTKFKYFPRDVSETHTSLHSTELQLILHCEPGCCKRLRLSFDCEKDFCVNTIMYCFINLKTFFFFLRYGETAQGFRYIPKQQIVTFTFVNIWTKIKQNH